MISELRRTPGWYWLAIGVALGALLTSVVAPLAWEDSTDEVAAGAGEAALPSDALSVPGGTPDVDGGGADGAAPSRGPGETTVAAETPSSDTGGSGGPATSAGGATDEGVTASTIKVGIPVPDLGGAAQLGFNIPGASPEDFKRSWHAYIDGYINSHGGIHGRKVVPVFRTYDPITEDSMRATCIGLTEDEKVFAVLDTGGAFRGAALSCVTVEHRTLMIQGYGVAAETQQRAQGLLWTVAQGNTRILQNQVAELHRLGLLNGKKIGVMNMDCPTDVRTVKDGSLATLKQLGYKTEAQFIFSCDVSTAASQVPVAVNTMRGAGVEVLLNHSRATESGSFAQQAEKQMYFPQYVTSDYYLTNGIIYLQSHPQSYAGTLSITARRVGEWQDERPEGPEAQECSNIARERYSSEPARSEDHYGGGQMSCAVVQLFRDAAQQVGPALTRRAMSQALGMLRGAPAPYNIGEIASFGPTRYDGGTLVRLLVADMSCSPRKADGQGDGPCWHIKTEPVEARF